MSYSALTLHEFLAEVLKAYDVETSLALLTDSMSSEYQAFHEKTVAAHTGLIAVNTLGVTYHITRVSNIRNTTGYERYTWEVFDNQTLDTLDQGNIAYRLFVEKWHDWVTIPLDA